MLGEGAEARLYLADVFGEPAVLKTRESKAYRIPRLDDEIRRGRTRREAKMMLRLGASGIKVPKVLGSGPFSICMERLDGRLLKDSRLDPKIMMQIGMILGKFHNSNVAHGDFTPANIMLCKDGIYVIDFGLSSISESVEEKALDLLLMKRSVPKAAYLDFKKGYSVSCKGSKLLLERLRRIELRGRYQIRTLE